MLVSNFRIATADVNAVAAVDQGFLDMAAQTVAARRGWPRDRLNDGVRIGPGSGRNDREDILNLMQVTGTQQKADIIQFAARFYPEARTS